MATCSAIHGPADHGVRSDMLRRLAAASLAIGRRLPYDVVDRQGHVLLRRGSPMNSPDDVRRLAEQGYRRIRPVAAESVFAGMQGLIRLLAEIEKEVIAGDSDVHFKPRILALVKNLIEITDTDPDAGFASVHLDFRHSYTAVHQIMAGLICCRLSLVSGLSPEARFSLVAAAVTHDFGILRLRCEYDAIPEWTLSCRERVRSHPAESIALLRENGIDDERWFDAIRDHHEYLDGSGYLGKRGDEISQEGRIMALADALSSMLRPRPYRDRLIARNALETLYTCDLERYDGKLIESLIWDFGFLPPGSMLRLANKELAVSVRHMPGLLELPSVASLTDARGQPRTQPVPRDVGRPEFAVVDTLDPAIACRAARLLEACWGSAAR